nr:EOG090X06Q2 [Ceriodaphnia reticulata]
MSSPVSKTEKEKQKLIQEKCQTILASMLRDEDNKYCVDCDAKGPRWASWNLGIFLCIRCAGIHRNLGVHISRVKSVNLDSWTPEQVVSLQQMGNSRARAVYEANLPDSFRRPQTDSTLESFIRAKYETKKYIAKEWVCPPPVKVSWDAEIEMEMKRKKEAKRKTNGSPAAPVELPNPSLPAPVEASLPAPTKISSAAQDLLGLDTVVSNSAGNDLFGGLLTTVAPPANGANGSTVGGASKNADEDSFFNQKAPSTTEKRTLDKNSILALYNQGGTNTSAAAVPPMQNMFAAQGVYASPQPVFAPAPSMNQSAGMMAGNYNPLMQQGNMFSSPMFSTNGAIPQTGAAQMGQLSQQLSGLNFGQAVHNPMMPAPAAPLVPGMMMGNPAMGMNPALAATNNPYMFLSSTGMQPASQQQQQHPATLSTNLWQ